ERARELQQLGHQIGKRRHWAMHVVRLHRDALDTRSNQDRLRAQLLGEPSLPHPRLADDHYALRIARPRPREPLLERGHLRVAPQERKRQWRSIDLPRPLADPSLEKRRWQLEIGPSPPHF